MEESKAVTIVATLAGGVDPLTGEVFPDDSPYQAPLVIRALYTLLRVVDRRMVTVKKRRPDLPENAGKAWSTGEDKELLQHFDVGNSIQDIATLHKRTQAGIEARLEKLGRLKPDDRLDPRRFYSASARAEMRSEPLPVPDHNPLEQQGAIESQPDAGAGEVKE